MYIQAYFYTLFIIYIISYIMLPANFA